MNPKRGWGVFRGADQKPLSTEKLLSQVSLFRGLDQTQLSQLAARTETRRYEGGQVVVAENEAGDALHIVVSGSLDVYRERPGRDPVRIDNLGPGQFFGEMALIEDYPRLATIRAAEPATCLALDKKQFQEELAAHPTIAVALVLEVSRRLRNTLDVLDANG